MVYYRFYDPAFRHDLKYQKGKLVRIKTMNALTDLRERQHRVKEVIELELKKLKEEGYNPITELYGNSSLSTVKPSTPFFQAISDAETNINSSKSTKRDLKSVLRFIEKASRQLGLYNLPISNVSRKHVKLLLAQIESNQGKESVHRYNKNRTYLMMLFKELVELEVTETNPVREISKKQRMVPLRTVLKPKERKQVDDHLKLKHYRFWLFTNIFFQSGARLTEIMQVKRKDVNLHEQYFVVTIKKGKLYKQVQKPITDIALTFWTEAVENAGVEHYIFSKGLRPGNSPINTDQITKRWKLHVKDKLQIEADFYSLKHLHLDEIAAQSGIEDAAAMASHSSSKTTIKHYAVNEKYRQDQRLKSMSISFGG
jgi:integrase